MLRKWNRILALILAMVVMTTTFNSSLASVRVYAGEFDENTTLEPTPDPVPTEEPLAEEPAVITDPPEQEEPPAPPAETTTVEEEPKSEEPPQTEEAPKTEEAANNDENQQKAADGALDENAQQDANENNGDNNLPPAAVPEAAPEAPVEPAPNAAPKLMMSPAPANEENSITISYSAGENGSVSSSGETITGGNGALGSTATPNEGYEFDKWVNESGEGIFFSATFVPEGDYLVDGASYTALFKEAVTVPVVTTRYTVTYLVDDAVFREQVYTDDDNELVLPERPFKSGYFFKGWAYNGNILSNGVAVVNDMEISAVFDEIKLFQVTVKYYYEVPGTGKKYFDSSSRQIEKSSFPITITSPESVTADLGSLHPTYYPKQSSIQISLSDIDINSIQVIEDDGVAIGIVDNFEVEYLPNDVTYRVSYMLKKISGDGYAEHSHIDHNGFIGTTITPEIKSIEGAEFESLESAELTENGQVFYVYYTRLEYTLRYVTGEGSYIESVVAPYGSNISVTSTRPTRAGYEFAGWYKDAGLTQSAGNSVELTNDINLYAKWNPVLVDYTVIYLIENADDDGYSYLANKVKKAYANTEVTETAAGEKPNNLDKTNFTFKEATTEVVKADGTSVVIARYSRNVYTITWNGERYSIRNQKYPGTYGSASLTAKYGATITEQWIATFNTPYPDYAWSFTKKNDDKIVNKDKMESGNKNIYAFDYSTDKIQILRYWLENYSAGDSTLTVERNGKTYGLSKEVTVKFGYLYRIQDFYDIYGYTQGDYTATYIKNGQTKNYTLGDETPNAELHVDFYYNANKGTLVLYNYDGTSIGSYEITYNADITSYLTNNIPTHPVTGATWKGWYTDADRTALYAGNYKMPTGLALYAGFQLPTFTVTYKDGDTVLGTRTYEYNTTAEEISAPAKEGYTFAGWCSDAGCTDVYDFAKPVTEDITIYANWKRNAISYTVKYVNDANDVAVADPKVVISPILKKGDVVKETAINIAGMIPDQSEKTLTLDYENNVITFRYTKKLTNLKYSVYYVLKDHPDVEVHAPKLNKDISGNYISVTEQAAAIDKTFMRMNYPDYADGEYYPEEDIIEYILSAGENKITFYYNSYASGKAVISYVDMAGNPIPGMEEIVVTGKAGESHQIDTTVDGYTYNKTTDGNKVVGTSITFRDGTVYRYVYMQKNLTIRAKNKSKAYDGTPLVSSGVDDITVDGLVNGHRVTGISYTGSQTLGGSSPTTPKDAVISGATSDYYIIKYQPGTLTVSKKTVYVTITGATVNTVYDGDVHTAGYTVDISDSSFLEEYIKFNGSVSSISRVDAGTTDLKLAGFFSTKPEYMGTFVVSYLVTDGYVTITPRPLTLETESLTKTYDGTELNSADGDTNAWSITGFAKDEKAHIDYMTGTQTEAGSSQNYYHSIIWDTAKEANYEVTKYIMGTLEVTKANVTVTITGRTQTFNYDGAPHTVSGYDVTNISNNLYKETDFIRKATLPAASVTRTEKGKDFMGLAETDFVNNNPNFEATFVVNDGWVEIAGSEEIKVNITGNTLTKEYTGDEYSVTGYTVDIVVPDGVQAYTEADFTYTGSKTVSGTNAGTYQMNLDVTKFTNLNSNYTVKFEIVKDGQLEITKKNVNVNIAGAKVDTTYNGEEQEASGYSVVSIDSTLYKETDFTGPTAIKVAATDASDTPYMMGLTGSAFTNNNANFSVTFNVTDGQLKIGKLPVTVTIKGAQKEEEYNGQEQKAVGYSVSIGNSLYMNTMFTKPDPTNVVAALKNKGQKYMGLSSDMFANTNANFDVTFDVTDGFIKINAQTAPYVIKVSGKKDTKTYNGSEQQVSGYVPENTVDDTITFSLLPGKAVAKGTNVGNYPMNLSPSDFTASSENYTTIQFEVVNDGELVIKKATRTAPTLNKYEGVYDGNPHTVTITNSIAGDSFTYMVDGVAVAGTPYATKVNDSIAEVTVLVTNPNYEDVTIGPEPITITPKKITVSTGSDSKAYDGKPLTKDSASISGLVSGETATAKANGSITEVGSASNTYLLIWGSADNTNYTVAESLGTLTITANNTQITFQAPSDSKVYDGTPLVADNTGEKKVTVTGLPEGFTATASAHGSQTNVGSSDNLVGDDYVIYDKNNQVRTGSFTNIKREKGTLTVTKRTVIVTTGADSKKYDGTPLTNPTVNISNLAAGESVTLKATGSITEVGSAPNTYSIEWTGADVNNYTVKDSLGTLTVTKTDVEVILTAGSDTKPYDGTPLTNDTLTYSGLPAGYYATATISGSQTDAGTGANTITSYKIYDGNDNEKTGNFTKVTKVPGKLTVVALPVTVTTGSFSRPYNGQELKLDDASISGLLPSENAIVKVSATGKITDPGSVTNDYSIDWGTVNKNNYTITPVLGTLTVTTNSSTVTFTAASDSKVYDGTELKNNEVTVSGLPAGLTYSAKAVGTVTDVGTVANKVADGFIIKSGTKDVTENFTDIKRVDGKLEVKPLSIVVKAEGNKESQKYDGKEHTANGYKITAIEDSLGNKNTLYKENYIRFTGEAKAARTIAGTTNMNLVKEQFANTNANFQVTFNVTDGSITINPLADGEKFKVNVETKDVEIEYDGKVHTGFDFAAEGGTSKSALQNAISTVTNLISNLVAPLTASASDGEKTITVGGVSYKISGLDVPTTAKDVGTYPLTITGTLKVTDDKGNDVTNMFDLVVGKTGTLTITKRAITVTSGSATKAYDGAALTSSEITTDRPWANNEAVGYNITGKQTDEGSSNNTFDIVAGAGTDLNNYLITKVFGTLTVTKGSGTTPGSDPGTPPGSDPGTPPGSDPGTPPGSDPGTPPGSDPGTPPGSDPGTPPGSDPGTPPGSDPGTTDTPSGGTDVTASTGVTIADEATPLAATAGAGVNADGTSALADAALATGDGNGIGAMDTSQGQVLGAKRQKDGQVLGARRGKTSDDSDSLSRIMAILIASVVSIYLLMTIRKRKEEE